LNTPSRSDSPTTMNPIGYPDTVNKFLVTIIQLRNISIVVSVVMCMLCTPAYILLKLGVAEGSDSGFNTYTYQYRWIASAAMLTGLPPAITILVLYIIVVFVLLSSLHMLRPASPKPPLHPSPATGIQSSPDLSTKLDSPPSPSSSSSSSPSVVSTPYWSLFLIVCVVVGDVCLVGAMYALYISLLVREFFSYDIISVVQFLLGLIRMVANRLCIYTISKVYHSDISHRLILSTTVLQFNNVIIPAIVPLLTDNTCFSDALNPAEPITGYYFLPVCSEYVHRQLDGVIYCQGVDIVSSETHYRPSFTYGFQCSTSIITSFVPILVYSYAISFVLFILQWVFISSDLSIPPPSKSSSNDQVTNSLNYTSTTPPPTTPPLAFDIVRKLAVQHQPPLNLCSSLTSLMSHFQIQLVFGFACPYLALMIAVCFCAQCTVIVTKCARMIENSRLDSRHHFHPSSSSHNNHQRDLWSNRNSVRQFDSSPSLVHSSIHHTWKIILLVSSLLIGVLMVDISADDPNSSVLISLIFPSISFGIVSIVCFFWTSEVRSHRLSGILLEDIEIIERERESKGECF
jgi:hypothetical protein